MPGPEEHVWLIGDRHASGALQHVEELSSPLVDMPGLPTSRAEALFDDAQLVGLIQVPPITVFAPAIVRAVVSGDVCNGRRERRGHAGTVKPYPWVRVNPIWVDARARGA